jgi:hypothetical protein
VRTTPRDGNGTCWIPEVEAVRFGVASLFCFRSCLASLWLIHLNTHHVTSPSYECYQLQSLFVWGKFWSTLDVLLKVWSWHNFHGKSWHSWLLQLHFPPPLSFTSIVASPLPFWEERPVKERPENEFCHKVEEFFFEDLTMWKRCSCILYYCLWFTRDQLFSEISWSRDQLI